jgi:hypothetical protein
MTANEEGGVLAGCFGLGLACRGLWGGEIALSHRLAVDDVLAEGGLLD